MTIADTTVHQGLATEVRVAAALRPSTAEICKARHRLHRKAFVVAMLTFASYTMLVFGQHAVVVTVLAATSFHTPSASTRSFATDPSP